MLFRQGTDAGKRAGTRSGGATEAQLKELRSKARRRLIGALALVLAAFIVVPWLFDEPAPDDAHAPVVVPAAPAGLPPTSSIPAPVDAAPHAGDDAAANPNQGSVSAPDPANEPNSAPHAPEPAAAQPESPAVAVPPIQPPAPPPAVDKPAEEPAKPAKPAKSMERTDDGSVALALLSGKSPDNKAASASGQGRYYLQVAAYTTEQDAQSRRDSLRQAGVTDAYVERGQSGGRTVYRLRVGPFGSHEAAQAAQARLRALGYQNGLISDK
ncbi:MAG: SPOR domain-containing protein [Castellaniella sp.]|uniref:SPOR domain-containing protein n=1 Tax=Castellaniella sp. TaxID=1955812 RepID=UPI003C756EEB